MDNRQKLAEKIIKYLEDRLNCKNVLSFIKKTIEKPTEEGIQDAQLKIGKVPIALKIIDYDESDAYENVEGDILDKKDIARLYETFDFIMEANYTGFAYFPYLYGVLNCHDKVQDSKMYIFSEAFDGNLLKLINELTHPSEWYDIIFQLIMINYYFEIMYNHYYSNRYLGNYLYRKLKNPIIKEYELNGFKFNISHKYLIVLWDFGKLIKITGENKDQLVRNIDLINEFIRDNYDELKIKPSNRIIKLLYDIHNNPKDTAMILDQYYNVKESESTQ